MAAPRGLDSRVRRAAELAVLEFRNTYGFLPVITSTYRSKAEQTQLYRAWLAGKSAWPANPPGQSGHQYGLAWDSWVPDAYMPAWTTIRESYGWRVPPNDVIHAEVPSWPNYVRRGR